MIWYVVGELVFIATAGLFIWLVFGASFGGGNSSSEGGGKPPEPDPNFPTESPAGRDALKNYVKPTEIISDDILRLEEKNQDPKPA